MNFHQSINHVRALNKDRVTAQGVGFAALRPEINGKAVAGRFGNPLQCANGCLRPASLQPRNISLIGFLFTASLVI